MPRTLRYSLDWLTNPARARGRTTLPRLLNLPITGNCNSRCVMCDVWKTRSHDEVTADQLRDLLRGPLFRRIQHVGISGGEPTLRKDLPESVAAILEALPDLRSFSITSHGFQAKRWEQFAPRIRELCEQRGVPLRLNFSLDGVGEVHDRVRGLKGAFGRTLASVEVAEGDGVPIQLQATVSRDNVYSVHALLRYAVDRGSDVLFRRATTIERLDNRESVRDVALDESEDSFFADFLRSQPLHDATANPARRLFYRDLAERLETGRERRAPCYYQHEGLVLDEHANLYHCSISTEPIGNALEEDAYDLYFSEKSEAIRRRLLTQICPACVHDQSGAWSPASLAAEVLRASQPGRRAQQAIRRLRFAGELASYAANAVSSRRKPPDNTSTDEAAFASAVIVGAYGGEHVGDAAILGGVIQRLHQRHGTRRVVVLSSRPDRTRHWVRGLETPCEIEVRPAEVRAIAEEAGRDTPVVWGGGPIMDSPPVLLRNLRVIEAAARRGAAVQLEGVGIGPFRSGLSRRLAARIAEAAHRVTVRSARHAEDPILASRSVEVTDDPAFDYLATREQPTRIRLIERQRIDEATTHESPTVRVGINLRPLWRKYFSCSPAEAERTFDAMLENIAEAMAQLEGTEDRPAPTFIAFAMNADHYGFSDLHAAYRLGDRVSSTVDYRVVECELGVDAAIHLIERFDIMLAMRFHACIFGLSRGIPTLGIDYQLGGRGKIADLLSSRGMQQRVTSLDTLDSRWLMNHVLADTRGKTTAATRVSLPLASTSAS